VYSNLYSRLQNLQFNGFAKAIHNNMSCAFMANIDFYWTYCADRRKTRRDNGGAGGVEAV